MPTVCSWPLSNECMPTEQNPTSMDHQDTNEYPNCKAHVSRPNDQSGGFTRACLHSTLILGHQVNIQIPTSEPEINMVLYDDIRKKPETIMAKVTPQWLSPHHPHPHLY